MNVETMKRYKGYVIEKTLLAKPLDTNTNSYLQDEIEFNKESSGFFTQQNKSELLKTSLVEVVAKDLLSQIKNYARYRNMTGSKSISDLITVHGLHKDALELLDIYEVLYTWNSIALLEDLEDDAQMEASKCWAYFKTSRNQPPMGWLEFWSIKLLHLLKFHGYCKYGNLQSDTTDSPNDNNVNDDQNQTTWRNSPQQIAVYDEGENNQQYSTTNSQEYPVYQNKRQEEQYSAIPSHQQQFETTTIPTTTATTTTTGDERQLLNNSKSQQQYMLVNQRAGYYNQQANDLSYQQQQQQQQPQVGYQIVLPTYGQTGQQYQQNYCYVSSNQIIPGQYQFCNVQQPQQQQQQPQQQQQISQFCEPEQLKKIIADLTNDNDNDMGDIGNVLTNPTFSDDDNSFIHNI